MVRPVAPPEYGRPGRIPLSPSPHILPSSARMPTVPAAVVLNSEERMDRIDAMKVFVSAVDAGSLARAGKRLGKSPAAVSRAIAFLEAHVGTELLHRTTLSLRLS